MNTATDRTHSARTATGYEVIGGRTVRADFVTGRNQWKVVPYEDSWQARVTYGGDSYTLVLDDTRPYTGTVYIAGAPLTPIGMALDGSTPDKAARDLIRVLKELE